MADKNLKKDRQRAIKATEKEVNRLRRNLTREAKSAFAKSKKSGGEVAKNAAERSEAFMKALSRETESFVNKVFKAIEKGAHLVVEKTEATDGGATTADAAASARPAAKPKGRKTGAVKRAATRKSVAKRSAAKKPTAKKAVNKRAVKTAPAKRRASRRSD